MNDKPVILSESEELAVQRFLNDLTMVEAVRKVLLSGVYSDGVMTPGTPADPLKNFILGAFTTQHAALLSHEEKGMRLEAILNAISMVESGFRALEKYKAVEAVTEDPKPKHV